MINYVRTTEPTAYRPDDTGTDNVGQQGREMEILTLRRREEEKKKARLHWTLLRDSVKNVSQAVEHADAKEVRLMHGIHHDRKLNHSVPIVHAIFIPQTKNYLTTDGETVWQFLEDGRLKLMITPEASMDRFVHVAHSNQFVGWNHKRNTLYLMSDMFEIKSRVQMSGEIHMAVYNHSTQEILTAGPGFITSWVFRYGGRHLIPRKTTTTEFTDLELLSLLALEETPRRAQRVFFVCGKGVVVYNVFEGEQLCHQRELHVRPITAIAFFTPLKFLITGALDGCIKVWDGDWQVKMVFVGHSDVITCLAIYPQGPLFISAAKDCTIRVWSMETADEVDKTSLVEAVQGLVTTPNYDIFFTYDNRKVDLWRLNHLFHVHTYIGHRVQKIKLTTHPFLPVRAVLICRDASVRIVSPPDGEVITTLLMPHATGLVDAAYAIAENTLFSVCGNGDIIKSKTDINPCSVQARWECQSFAEVCRCLLVYEYVVEPAVSDVVSPRAKHSTATRLSASKQLQKNRTLLFGGCKDGHICVFDWDTGKIEFKIEAHVSKGVETMLANTKLDQLVSAGQDNIIKVWRVYPFAEESLGLLMSFYCAQRPVRLSTVKSRLCVAFQDPATATFSIVLYNLPHKHRQDHKPDDDHQDTITGLTSCSRMKLFASSSMDGTVRVWNEDNTLVRLLKLNAIPNSLAFCSSRGDLLVGIGLHLFHIPWYRYLPRPYLRKMVSMRFVDPKSEAPLPYDQNALDQMEKYDVKRLKAAHASFKVTQLEDELSTEEEEELMQEKRIREMAFAELEIRENELGLIREGGRSAYKKPKSTKKTQREAMQNYMKMYYNKPRIVLPSDESFEEAFEPGKHEEAEDVFHPDNLPQTFFQEIHRNRTPGGSAHGLTPSGFVPNSVLVKIMYPPSPPPPDPASLLPYRPPELTAKQLSEIRAFRKEREPSFFGPSVSFADREESFDLTQRTLQFDFDEDEEEKEDEDMIDEGAMMEKSGSETEMKSETDLVGQKAPATAPSVGFPPLPARPVRKKKAAIEEEEEEEEEDMWGTKPKQQSSLANKFKHFLEEPEPKAKRAEERVKEAEVAEDGPVEPELPKPLPREPPKPLRPITKLVSRPRPRTLAPRSPTPPPPPSPLPNFIAQFKGEEWFEKYFPNCNETTMPKPWTGDTFVDMILKLLRFASFPHKTRVAEAIVLVHLQDPLSPATCLAAHRMLLVALNHHAHTPVCAVPEQKEFIAAALKAVLAVGPADRDFMLEMLTQFLDGDHDVRSLVLDSLQSVGLDDPHHQLQKELDSWDIWNVEEAQRKADLNRMCGQWLDRWMTSYKLHIKDTVERLQKGHNVHGRMARGALASRASRLPESRKESAVPSECASISTFSGAGDFTRPSTQHSLTMTIEHPDASVADHATYLEAVNYFCEMMTDKEMEALRRGETLKRGGKNAADASQNKNTVLVLPKIAQKPALVRLGESHTSKWRQTRSAAFSGDWSQMALLGKGRKPVPGELNGFVSCINLPMKPVHLTPFPSPLDALDAHYSQPVLITLKTAQKYFLPAASVVPRELQMASGS